jgi:hypothetical protein
MMQLWRNDSERCNFVAQLLPKEQRTEILDREIQGYAKQGYQVVSRTDTTAQLVKPKKFSFLLFVVLLILMVLPAILYILWYATRGNQSVYLSVDEYGKVKRT